ncbi:MAG: RND transporter [Leptospiraceae bacterium]|nr:hypothetical protein [Leptospiraceae bacterium]MCP5510764.1 RND transporter [Leptospiraceae bacterium]
MLEWLDNVPYSLLLIAAVFLGLAPFYPEPHLKEKIRMLRNGTLKRPLDIFDLIYHLIPIFLLGVKFLRQNMG